MIGGFILFLLLTSGVSAFNNLEMPNEIKSRSRGHLIVDPNGNGDYINIQDAIDNASSGDIIRVYAGIYLEDIVINKTLTLQGNGSNSTIINGQGSNIVVHIISNWVNISGFTINSIGDSGKSIYGIKLDNAQNCTISDNYCINTIIGILLNDSNFNTINNNTCFLNEKYGISLNFSNINTIKNNTCKLYKCTYVLEMRSSFNLPPHVDYIEGFWANFMGINVEESNSNFIINNTCIFNDAGIYLNNSRSNMIENNMCYSNFWYGIACWGSKFDSVVNNNCSNNNRAGIIISSDSSIVRDNLCAKNRYGLGIAGSVNAEIKNNYCDSNFCGIYIEESSAITITNNSCKDSEDGGIYVYLRSESIKINNNNCSNNQYGMTIDADSSIITNNIVSSNEEYGIGASGSQINIENNTCNLNGGGGIIITSEFGKVKNNYLFPTSGPGIHLSGSYSCTLQNNTMQSCGLKISGVEQYKWDSHFIDSSNTVNGKPIYYWKNADIGIIPSGAGQIILGNCKNVKIENQNLSNCNIGILLGFSQHNLLVNNSCILNDYGIKLYESNDNSIKNNICDSNNFDGIFLNWNCEDNQIYNNDCYFNEHNGIMLHNSNSNIIHNNSCSFNSEDGVSINYHSNANIIKNNSCIKNGYIGIVVGGSDYNKISFNTLINNTNWGVYLGRYQGLDSVNNEVHHNNFIDNNWSRGQAYDYGINNKWNTTTQGNYWSDLLEPDEDSDGVVDKPYVISGRAGAKDFYPLTKPISDSKDNFEHFFQNITIELELDKYTYYSNENITGQLTITNNNYFDIYNINPLSIGANISLLPLIVVQITNRDSKEVYYTRFGDIFIIENYSKMVINFSLTDFYYNEVGSGKSFKLPAGNYSISMNFEAYIANGTYSVIHSNSDSFRIINTPSGLENISIQLNLTKHKFYSGEAITGTINITNKNPFDFDLVDIETQIAGNVNFHVLSKYNINEYAVFYNYYPWQDRVVKADSTLIINFDIDEIVKLPLSSKELVYIDLEVGNYSIYTYFYHRDYELRSNEVDFQIIEQEFPELENIEITLFLDKLEFYDDEPITGRVVIKNNNPFNISLNNMEFQRNPMYFFNIYSIDNSKQFGGVSEEYMEYLLINTDVTAIFNFKISKYIKLPGSGRHTNYTKPEPGNYYIYSFFYYVNVTNTTQLNSNTSYFEIISNESSHLNGDSDGPSNGRGWYSESFIAGSTVLITVVIVLISTIFVLNTELGKYSFFSAIAPLYTKTRKKKKDHEYGYIKGSIRGYVVGNPGESYNNIKRVLELPNGTLAYYLKVLERERIIRSERDGFMRRFYPAKGTITSDMIELSEIQQKIKSIVQNFPGISQKDILTKLDISQQKLNYHIKLLEDARILKLERDGKLTKCYVVEEV